MTTPSERIWRALPDDDGPDLRDTLPAAPARRETLVPVAARVADVRPLSRAAGLQGSGAVLDLIERTVRDRSLSTAQVQFFVHAVLDEDVEG